MISVGFLLMPKFQDSRRNHCDDEADGSGCTDWLINHPDNCLPMSLWLEFFQIASESWMLCITYDLVITISNPFTSLASRSPLLSFHLTALPSSLRIKYYHLFSWGIASLMILLLTATHSYGVYFVDEDLQADGLCWIKNHDEFGGYSPRPWLFLILPLLLFYSYAMYVIHRAREMLDPTSPESRHSGLLKTHFHRLFALDSNTRTIRIYVGYWIFFLASTLLVFISANSSHFGTDTRAVSTSLSNLVLLCFGGKGYVDLIVLASILLSRSYKICANERTPRGGGGVEGGDEDGEDYFHLNRGLKLQLMTFITTGLKRANEELLGEEGFAEEGRSACEPSGGRIGSRMWAITVKTPTAGGARGEVESDLSRGLTDQCLTQEQYREYLREEGSVQVETIIPVERVSVAQRQSSLSRERDSLASLGHYLSSFSRKGQESNTLMDVEILQRKGTNDQALLSKRLTEGRQDQENIAWRWLRCLLPSLHPTSSSSLSLRSGRLVSSSTRTVARRCLKNISLRSSRRSGGALASKRSTKSTPTLLHLHSPSPPWTVSSRASTWRRWESQRAVPRERSSSSLATINSSPSLAPGKR
jgi:hypothetical protein